MKKFYALPDLSYEFNALEPYISEEQLKVHHDKHHKAYVDGANKILENLDSARDNDNILDMKCTLKSLSWNQGGHVLHSLYWENLSPNGGGEPDGKIKEMIENEFWGFDRFKREFNATAMSVEGSGWAVLAYCKKTNRPVIMQIEKHNTNITPMFEILLVLDMFEHAYYIDYKNEKGKYVEAFWNIVDWAKVNERV